MPTNCTRKLRCLCSTISSATGWFKGISPSAAVFLQHSSLERHAPSFGMMALRGRTSRQHRSSFGTGICNCRSGLLCLEKKDAQVLITLPFTPSRHACKRYPTRSPDRDGERKYHAINYFRFSANKNARVKITFSFHPCLKYTYLSRVCSLRMM